MACMRAAIVRRIVSAQQQAADSEELRKLKGQRRVRRLRARKECRAVGSGAVLCALALVRARCAGRACASKT